MIKLSLAAILILPIAAQAFDLTIGLKTGSTSFDYSEYGSDGSLLDTEFKKLTEGRILNSSGVDLTISANSGILLKKNFVNIGYDYSSFQTKYTGSLLFGGGGYGSVISSTANTVDNYFIKYGEGTNLTKNLSSDLTIGIGFKEWDRKLSTIQDEVYSFKYFTLGNNYSYKLTKNLSTGIGLEGFYAISPEMKAITAGTNITFDLGKTYGYSIKVPLEYKVDKITLFTEYEYGYQNINKSNVVSGFYEPDSENFLNKVMIGAKYTY